jgi:hypothetical protein
MPGPKINEKLGLRPAPPRAMMRDAGKDEAARLKTSRQCPLCGERWVVENVIHGVAKAMCSRCSYNWRPGVDGPA